MKPNAKQPEVKKTTITVTNPAAVPNISKSASHINHPAPITPNPAQEKQKVDVSYVKPGSAVKHKVFGDGKVITIKDGKIIVAFGKAEKTFLFPQAFEQGFLIK